MAVYDARDWPLPMAEAGPHERAAAGWLWGQDAPDILGYVDPLPESVRPEGEPAEGIPILRHPDLMLLAEPEVWEVVDAFRDGVETALSRADYQVMSNFELELWNEMRAAKLRAERPKPEAGADG